METSKMKNMVVLKNLPSNMVDEAIIIFKETQKVKEKELIDKSGTISATQGKSKSKEFILKEAEMLVNDYIKKIEAKKQPTIKNDLNKKYIILKRYSIVSTILFCISLIINFI